MSKHIKHALFVLITCLFVFIYIFDFSYTMQTVKVCFILHLRQTQTTSVDSMGSTSGCIKALLTKCYSYHCHKCNSSVSLKTSATSYIHVRDRLVLKCQRSG